MNYDAGVVLSLFLIFDDFEPLCSWKLLEYISLQKHFEARKLPKEDFLFKSFSSSDKEAKDKGNKRANNFTHEV